MFFHGMNYEYLLYQYPVLSPRLTILRQNNTQKLDRKHLLQRYGFEPVHFLESSPEYSVSECLEECFEFGDVVLVYNALPKPILQLSSHEVGVAVIDTREANYIAIRDKSSLTRLHKLYPYIPILIYKA